jgi:ABC-type sugar transport system permease subunit
MPVHAAGCGFLILFLSYPLGLGVWLAFTDTKIGRAGHFIGLENYESLGAIPSSGPRSSTRCSIPSSRHR